MLKKSSGVPCGHQRGGQGAIRQICLIFAQGIVQRQIVLYKNLYGDLEAHYGTEVSQSFRDGACQSKSIHVPAAAIERTIFRGPSVGPCIALGSPSGLLPIWHSPGCQKAFQQQRASITLLVLKTGMRMKAASVVTRTIERGKGRGAGLLNCIAVGQGLRPQGMHRPADAVPAREVASGEMSPASGGPGGPTRQAAA